MLPCSVQVLCLWFSQPAPCISLHTIKGLILVMESGCVLCVVKTNFFMNFKGQTSKSHTMPRNSDAGLFPGKCISDLLWTKWNWDRILSRYFGSSLSLSLRQWPTLVFIFMALFSGGSSKEVWEPRYNATFFTKLGAWHSTVPLIF